MSMIGKTLGTFECTALLGKGGMGEVYRATDQKLGRDVAIKVLPEEFAKDSDRVARFQREAKLLASLNHPNIASIYGLEQSDGTHFLVLELIEGDTLADRIKGGPIPAEESLKLALQIAEALEAAHEKGVIHRDLKPANIKVTPDGKVKVLDFGLAKAYSGEQAEVNLSHSPTLSEAATLQGVILGTAAYMSPEQARGNPVDKGADIWAFGVVLFEMLTGRQIFSENTVSDTLASVLKSEPEWQSLPANLHPRIRFLLERCLEKEHKNRYSGISDARVDIQKVVSDPGAVLVQPVAAAKPHSGFRNILPWIAAVLGIAIAGLAVWNLKPEESNPVIRFDYHLPEKQQFSDLDQPMLAISPDGNQLAYLTTDGIYLRSMNELEARLIPGTNVKPVQPFFSADGQWLGYWSRTEQKLKKININGGTPVSLTDELSVGFLSWDTEDKIVFAFAGKVMCIGAEGGKPELLTEVKDGYLMSPQMLPGGKSVIFTRYKQPYHQVMVQSLESGESKLLLEGSDARYLKTGHLIYILGNNLYAAPFDLDTLEVTGGEILLIEGVFNTNSRPQYNISESGTLVYIPETAGRIAYRTLVWVDRDGKEYPLEALPKTYRNPRISPDGTKVAFTIRELASADIWIWDLVRKNTIRLTRDAAIDSSPLWTPDGQRIAYASWRRTALGEIYWKPADGTGESEHIGSVPDRGILPYGWSADGKSLILTEVGYESTALYGIGMLSIEGDQERISLLQGEQMDPQPRISPDGRWMAYVSTISGQVEIYVCSYPDVSKQRQKVSTSGGTDPLWSPDGRELFYRNGDLVMVVKVEEEPSFNLATPDVLLQGVYVAPPSNAAYGSTSWDISPDGKRFLMMKSAEASGDESPILSKINIVVNWFEELKERVPVE